MKVLHIPYSYPPDPPGGTEVYVKGLVKELRSRGVDSLVAAAGHSKGSYEYEGTKVYRFLTSASQDLADLYGMRDDQALEALDGILKQESPDLLHLHALTAGASPGFGVLAKEYGAAVVFSYHTPAVSCQRGTLFRWGSTNCDGVLRGRTCSACTLQASGATRAGGYALAALPPKISARAGARLPRGRIATAVRMRELTEERHSAIKKTFRLADQVIAMAQWAKDVLIANGVDPRKITVIRHGLDTPQHLADGKASAAHDVLKFAWFGRASPTKGLSILIDALKGAPSLKVELDAYPLVQGATDQVFLADIRHRASSDPRINFKEPVDPRDVVATMGAYDLLAVPSQWFETGPLVVLEAFAAGIPVIGSDTPGIRELVRNGHNGILIERDNVAAWSQGLALVADRSTLLQLTGNVTAPPSMADSADATIAVYETALSGRTYAPARPRP